MKNSNTNSWYVAQVKLPSDRVWMDSLSIPRHHDLAVVQDNLRLYLMGNTLGREYRIIKRTIKTTEQVVNDDSLRLSQ